MSIFIDSAVQSDIQRAAKFGWVKGVTTNPSLLAAAGGDVDSNLLWLKDSGLSPIFYQLRSQDLDHMHKEAAKARDILGEHLVLKLEPSELGFRFAADEQLIPCCPTAIFSTAQALLAAQAEARYIAVYVNRASKLMGDGITLLSEIAEVLEGSSTEILAASLKSNDEVVAAHLAGAQHLTMPLNVLEGLAENEHSLAAIQSFKDNGVGLKV